ncbi:hypothetical protein CAL14_08600 [Bordetella genomosp. 9]|uniref:hypothetical protein n=1 Tax=Bordetella genomosp. 9 TaxID=1416803 RepID=UPI000A29279C|nr:hypothetical protein [Bordetella genomosp. 9]ARP90341.1 hypothetical protein CAL14_08600 [Bordetella genomosp. 9]
MPQHDHHRALCEDDLEVIAQAVGALPPGARMTPELLEYTRTIVGHCASIGDEYRDEDGSAGDEIRAAFGLG